VSRLEYANLFSDAEGIDISAQGKTLERTSSVLTLKGLSIFLAVVGPPFRVMNDVRHLPRVLPWAEIVKRLRRK